MNSREIFEKLEKHALAQCVTGRGLDTVLHCLRNGKPIPESHLPGRLLNILTDEEREVLKNLTSDQLNNIRNDCLFWTKEFRELKR